MSIVRDTIENLRKIDTIESTANNASSGLGDKQDTLVSGTNIKTINGASLLGGGDVEISGGAPTIDMSSKIINTPFYSINNTVYFSKINDNTILLSGTNVSGYACVCVVDVNTGQCGDAYVLKASSSIVYGLARLTDTDHLAILSDTSVVYLTVSGTTVTASAPTTAQYTPLESYINTFFWLSDDKSRLYVRRYSVQGIKEIIVNSTTKTVTDGSVYAHTTDYDNVNFMVRPTEFTKDGKNYVLISQQITSSPYTFSTILINLTDKSVATGTADAPTTSGLYSANGFVYVGNGKFLTCNCTNSPTAFSIDVYSISGANLTKVGYANSTTYEAFGTPVFIYDSVSKNILCGHKTTENMFKFYVSYYDNTLNSPSAITYKASISLYSPGNFISVGNTAYINYNDTSNNTVISYKLSVNGIEGRIIKGFYYSQYTNMFINNSSLFDNFIVINNTKYTTVGTIATYALNPMFINDTLLTIGYEKNVYGKVSLFIGEIQ